MAPNVTTPQEAKNKIVRNCVRRNTQVSTVSYFASFVCLFVCRSIYWVAIVWAMLNLYFSHCQASTLVSDMADRFLCFPLPLSALITAGFHCLPALSPGPGLFQFSWQQDASVWGLPWMFVSKHKPAIGKKKSSIKMKQIQYASSEQTCYMFAEIIEELETNSEPVITLSVATFKCFDFLNSNTIHPKRLRLRM